jgi:thiopurine S-methyltransferase
MDPNYWHNRWERSDTQAFHEKDGNPLFIKHFGALSLPKGARVFVPLCGKTGDIHILLRNGHRVAGAELSPIAVGQLFADLGVKPNITAFGPLQRYQAENIDIFLGDLFDLTRETLGPVDAVYDRAALVALPDAMRRRYAAHLMEISNKAPQLLIVFDYDQSRMEGPPFSISDREVKELYGGSYGITFVEGVDVAGGLKGKCAAMEKVWRLHHLT